MKLLAKLWLCIVVTAGSILPMVVTAYEPRLEAHVGKVMLTTLFAFSLTTFSLGYLFPPDPK